VVTAILHTLPVAVCNVTTGKTTCPLTELHLRGRLSRLGLGSRLPTLADALQDLLAVLVQLQLGDDDLGGVDADWHALAVGLLAVDALNVDDVFETVDAGDLALATLVGAPDDGDLVVLADGNCADLPGVRTVDSLSLFPILIPYCPSSAATQSGTDYRGETRR